MKAERSMLDALEIRRRAAAVRRCWSPEERNRRLGLPPDSPFRCHAGSSRSIEGDPGQRRWPSGEMWIVLPRALWG